MAGSQQELEDMLRLCVDEYCNKWRCAAHAKKSGVMTVECQDDGMICHTVSMTRFFVLCRNYAH